MTREEAKKEMLNITGSIYTETDELEDLIDKIYDDFENRTCKNCKFFKDNDDSESWCINEELNKQTDPDNKYDEWFTPTYDFGCRFHEI